jgi:signal transduction histidine kinase
VNATARVEDPLRVVVIDDTEDLRDLLRIALERGGMTVVGEAGDGLAGIDVVRTARPDVVLLDLSMPVMDGIEALPHLRALAPDAKIIVLSGFGANQMSERALANGADDYLQKGMPLGRVLARIREIALGPAVEEPSARALLAVPQAVLSDALSLSPYGVLEVEAHSPHHVINANPAATRLLGDHALAGRPLESVSGQVARLVTTLRGTAEPTYSATVAGRALRVTVRHASRAILLYLEESSDEINDLRRTVAATAHEIRGPVAVLNALAETVTHHNIADALQRDRLMSAVARQARVLDGITADLLIMAQAERGALRVEPRPVDPAATIQAVISDQRAPMALEVQDTRPVLADPLRLHQMVGNLFRNAVKHGRPPLTVRVGTRRDAPEMIGIEVADHGTGAPEEFRGRLFQEFARAAGAAAGGIGLGLHVVRTLAEAHGGSVSYAPADDGGAVFTLTLPVA